ncbi:MAG: hypothetical protein LBC92_05625 [Rickettsiales bacterium]|jgi:hypothetical protein|nr:hypothetical protein [Rickettsiales bacterium]
MFNKIKNFYNDYKQKTLLVVNNAKLLAKDTKVKFKDLYQTNYDTGMYHLKNGNLIDATFRFNIMSKLWKKKAEGKYYYAYCLILNGKIDKSRLILMGIKDDYPNADSLLHRIDNNEVGKIIEEYNATLAEKN